MGVYSLRYLCVKFSEPHAIAIICSWKSSNIAQSEPLWTVSWGGQNQRKTGRTLFSSISITACFSRVP